MRPSILTLRSMESNLGVPDSDLKHSFVPQETNSELTALMYQG